MEWLAALILPVLAGFVAGRIARDKGRSPTLWRWLTFFCCPLLIVLMLLPAKGAAGAGIATEAFAAALIILALVGAGIYAVSGSGGVATPRPPSADCDRVRDDAQDVNAALTQLLGGADLQLAMAQNDTGTVCRKLADIMPKLRRVRAAAAQCRVDDPFSGLVGDLLDQVAAGCK